jgi:hypothetical protein
LYEKIVQGSETHFDGQDEQSIRNRKFNPFHDASLTSLSCSFTAPTSLSCKDCIGHIEEAKKIAQSEVSVGIDKQNQFKQRQFRYNNSADKTMQKRNQGKE